MSETVENIDPSEIAKFEALASRWWDENSEFKPLHDINPLRLNYVEQHCGGLAGKAVLDVGCGGGLLSEGMACRGAKVTGIDMGEAPLTVAKLHLYESGQTVDYQQSTAEAFAENHPDQYDVVTCLEMLEHVPDPSSVIAACAKMVKPGGHLFFSTINRNAKAFTLAIVGAEYLLRMLPKGTHEYQKFIKPSELTQWCRQVKLTPIDISGMSYNPFNKEYKLSDDVAVNYLIYCQCDER